MRDLAGREGGSRGVDVGASVQPGGVVVLFPSP